MQQRQQLLMCSAGVETGATANHADRPPGRDPGLGTDHRGDGAAVQVSSMAAMFLESGRRSLAPALVSC